MSDLVSKESIITSYDPMHILPTSDRMADVEQMEKAALQLPQVEMPLRHFFAPGVYAREVTMFKGTMVTGKIHKHQHICIISKGDVSILTDDGVKRIQAPYTMISPPGCKRVLYIHEDTVWTTIHVTEETDLQKLEDEFVAKDRNEYMLFLESKS